MTDFFDTGPLLAYLTPARARRPARYFNEEVPMDIMAAIRQHEDELRRLPNVNGIATGKNESGEDVVVVFVEQKLPEDSLQPQEVVPKSIEGYPVDVRELGVVSAQTL